MIDEDFGARHHRLLFIEYQPGVGIGLHDHTSRRRTSSSKAACRRRWMERCMT
jgi:hypothetical protein